MRQPFIRDDRDIGCYGENCAPPRLCYYIAEDTDAFASQFAVWGSSSIALYVSFHVFAYSCSRAIPVSEHSHLYLLKEFEFLD